MFFSIILKFDLIRMYYGVLANGVLHTATYVGVLRMMNGELANPAHTY